MDRGRMMKFLNHPQSARRNGEVYREEVVPNIILPDSEDGKHDQQDSFTETPLQSKLVDRRTGLSPSARGYSVVALAGSSQPTKGPDAPTEYEASFGGELTFHGKVPACPSTGSLPPLAEFKFNPGATPITSANWDSASTLDYGPSTNTTAVGSDFSFVFAISLLVSWIGASPVERASPVSCGMRFVDSLGNKGEAVSFLTEYTL
jgi:hypothetical protein